MTDILLTQESGTWSEWSNASTRTSIVINTASRLGGTNYGIEVSNNASGTRPDISSYTQPASELRVAFRFNPNTASLSSQSTVWVVDDGLGNAGAYLYFNTDGTLTLSGIDDLGSPHDATTGIILVGDNTIECVITRATSSTASDGQVSINVNGLTVATITSIDNYDTFSGLPNQYADFAIDDFYGTGSYYIDEFTVRVDDSAVVFPVEKKILSLSVPLLGGSYMWYTYWEGGALYLGMIDKSTGMVLSEMNLGYSTSSELSANTYVAYVTALNDSTIYVYGRMNNPQSLGDPSHIIATTDGGATWKVVENLWGVDWCGSLTVDTFGTAYAIRCGSSVSTLYKGNTTGVSMLINMPFTSSVKHGGMSADSYGNVIIVSDSTDAKQIIKVAPPYTTVTDITANHGTTGTKRVDAI